MRKGLLAPQNTFLDTIAERFDGSRKFLDFGSGSGRGWVRLGSGSGQNMDRGWIRVSFEKVFLTCWCKNFYEQLFVLQNFL